MTRSRRWPRSIRRRLAWSNCATSAVSQLKKQQTFWVSLLQPSNVIGALPKPGFTERCREIVNARSKSNPIIYVVLFGVLCGSVVHQTKPQRHREIILGSFHDP